ncbi:MAG: DUF2269 domain-containing protein [Deltaproteobacteria bacterium]|nr:MAG: DUF2269 domain-containing protein [Deltaproteobacteria bacterium]
MLVPILKTLHVFGAVLFLGAGMMTAWYKVRADRSGDLRVLTWYQREIVRADWLFTAPSAVILPVTGLWLANIYGIPWNQGWVGWGLAGFLVSGVLWLPAVWLQIRMRQMAEHALKHDEELPALFHRMNRIWMALGIPAFLLAIFVIWMMVAKWSPTASIFP